MAPSYSSVTSREIVSRVILCFISVKIAQKLKSTQFVALAVLLANLIGKTNVFNTIIRAVLPTYDGRLVDKLANYVLFLKPAKKEYAEHINEHILETRENAKKVWKKYGKLVTKIPETGLPEHEITKMIDNIGNTVDKGLIGEFFSGSVYPYAFQREIESNVSRETKEDEASSGESYESLMKSLERLFSHAFSRSYLWNSLHEGEFGVGYWLNYQVIRMVADIFIKTNKTNAREKVMGLVTTGGTDSLMNMVRLYKEWGKANRNLDFGEGIMIACENIHAAVDKGCHQNGIKLIKVGLEPDGALSIPEFRRAVKAAGNNLVGCVVSTPSYTLGSVDNVKAAGQIAKEAGVGLHVDCCLGGFVINFVDEDYNQNFLDLPGVTSISCDTHKNGWAPKGSSVLMTMPVPDQVHEEINLFFYSTYAIPSWDGGVYGSPGNPGSQHVSHVLQAYVAMLRIGKNGYSAMARRINNAVSDINKIVSADDRIEVLGEHSIGKKGVNVIGFRIHPKLNWGVGASYALAFEMSKYKVVLSGVKGDRLHYLVTGRSALDPEFINKFKVAFTEGMKATEKAAQLVKSGKAQFGGDAGLYGTLDSAMSPTSENTKSTAELIGNKLLGQRVAHDLIKFHFYALQDPFSEDILN